MTDDEIVALAERISTNWVIRSYREDLIEFAKAIAAAERETCAKVCDEMTEAYGDNSAGRALGIAADKMRSNEQKSPAAESSPVD